MRISPARTLIRLRHDGRDFFGRFLLPHQGAAQIEMVRAGEIDRAPFHPALVLSLDELHGAAAFVAGRHQARSSCHSRMDLASSRQ